MNSEALIEAIISGMEKLPTLPGVAIRILEAVQKEETGLQELAEILSMDPPLSAEVLKIINSPYYGLNSRVTTVHHAVNMLGGTTVKNLALSFSVVKSFQGAVRDGFDYTQFWKDSLFTAVATKLLAGKLIPRLAEDAFFLGLLNDIGSLALNQCMPDQYSLVLTEKKKNQSTLLEAEYQVLGFTHTEVGSHMVDKWGLPEIFSVPIRYHHTPEKLTSREEDLQIFTRIAHMASLLADFVNLPDKPYQLGLIEYYADKYGMKDDFKVDVILDECFKLTETIYPIFELRIDSESGYIDMLEAARKQLIHLSSDFMNRLMEQKKRIEVLNEQATHDGLTKLINYQHFQNIMDDELYRSKRYRFPLTLMMLDLDYFKKVNDTYGHLAGDYVLRVVSEYLRQAMRQSDVVARYGGEEFAVLLPETPAEGAFILAERLREKLASVELNYGEHKLHVTMSVGIAAYSAKDDDSNTDLIRKADKALYLAKESGRNRCCMYPQN